MSDEIRRAQVYALWHSSLDWLPQVRGSIDTNAAGAIGFVSGRRVLCGRCRGTGRVRGEGTNAFACAQCVALMMKARETGDDWRPGPLHGCRPCLLCDGTGMRLARPGEQGEDEYRQRGKHGLIDAAATRSDTERQRDLEIARLDRTLQLATGEEDPDWWMAAALRAKAYLWRNGSYAELEGVMRVLAAAYPLRHRLVLRVEVHHEPIHVSDKTRALIDHTADWVAERMPAEIRVPAEHTPAQVNEARKDSLWRGRSGRHAEQREQRRLRVLRAYLEWGWSTAEIAAHESLSDRRVRQIVAEHQQSEPAA